MIDLSYLLFSYVLYPRRESATFLLATRLVRPSQIFVWGSLKLSTYKRAIRPLKRTQKMRIGVASLFIILTIPNLRLGSINLDISANHESRMFVEMFEKAIVEKKGTVADG